MEPTTVGTRFRHNDEIWETIEWDDEARSWLCFQPELTDEVTQDFFHETFIEQNRFDLERHAAGAVQTILNFSFEKDGLEEVIGFMPMIPERVAMEIEKSSGNYDGMVIDALWEVYLASQGSESLVEAAETGHNAVIKLVIDLVRVLELSREAMILTK